MNVGILLNIILSEDIFEANQTNQGVWQDKTFVLLDVQPRIMRLTKDFFAFFLKLHFDI